MRSSFMHFLVCIAPLCTSPTLFAQTGYSTDFENPPFNGSATGVSITGQGGFVLPAGSAEAGIYTYLGNTLALPTNGNGGGQFFAGSATATDVRADRMVTLPADCRVYVQFDMCCKYTGAAAPQGGNTVGSFALRREPAPTAAEKIRGGLVAKWSASTPSTWDADVFVGPSTFTMAQVPDPAFQELPVNVWHQWGYTVDFSTGEYTEIRITNGLTNETTAYRPPAGSMPVPLRNQLVQGTLQPVNFFRLHANDGDNLVAIDNVTMTYGATYETFGDGGCTGALGAPTLQPAAQSLPRLDATFHVRIGNLIPIERGLPVNMAIVATGLSRTLALGSTPLPLDLGPWGFPGCSLLVSPDSTQMVVGTGSTATWSVVVPNVPGLLGTEFYNQAFSLDSDPSRLTATNAGAGCIGY